MPKIISNDEQLRELVPNQLVTVKGETPLFDKIALFLDRSEDWVKTTFTSESTFNTICGYTSTNPLRITTARLVVADAMLNAIPQLDVVLTPNGFATTGTQNLVAASKSRIDRLTESMASLRDECIAALLLALPGASKWLNSKQAQFFGATLFPDLSLVNGCELKHRSKWEQYLQLRHRVIDIESSIAERWLSEELMSALRAEASSGTLTGERQDVVFKVRAQIIRVLNGEKTNPHRFADIVNFIRQRPETFPEWHGSATAELFAPPVFVNKKNSAGYFF